MNKVLLGIIITLLIVCIGEGYWIHREREEKNVLGMALAKQESALAKPKVPAGPKPVFITKGQVFANSPLFSKAYLIAPVTGPLSSDAQKALSGWTVSSVPNTDGTTTVTLTPKEAEDVQQTFTLKTGYKLYFIEMNLADDSTEVDKNRADDMGVLVDQNGIVQ